MRVFVKAKNGLPQDYDHFNAYCGFKEMGFETILFSTYAELSVSNKEDIVIGYIGTVKKRLSDFGIKIIDTDYPECLEKYLGRKIWKSTIDEVNSNPNL